ncbi:MazG nucleotide pyrophosphohydrolase domain-containing protein [Micrococcus luteus]
MGARVEKLVWVVAQLRRHCPWTRALTHGQLTEYLVEEAYEAVEAIETDADARTLCSELGDVLFQVVLHSAIAQDRGAFAMEDVAESITAKMLRRNPHVFTPDGDLRPAHELQDITVAQLERQWEAIKAREKAAAAADAAARRPDAAGSASPGPAPQGSGQAGEGAVVGTPGEQPPGRTTTTDAALADLLASLPAHLPALAAAGKAVDRAARREPNPLPPPADTPAHLESALADEDALGEALFTLVRHARAAGLDPERALRRRLRGPGAGPAR